MWVLGSVRGIVVRDKAACGAANFAVCLQPNGFTVNSVGAALLAVRQITTTFL
jgi:hypothetical protein